MTPTRTKIKQRQWHVARCIHCDFGSGMRGMDSCGRCRGTGSQLVHGPSGDRFPNTKDGWTRLVAQYGKQIE